MTTKCPHCQAPVRIQAKFCARCGQPISEPLPASPVVCAQCQRPVRPNARFCPHCGYSMLPLPQVAAPEPKPAASLWAAWERRLLVAIATLALLLLLGLGLLWQQSRPVVEAVPTPDVAATLTVQAATPTPLPGLATAVPVAP